ncbi:tetratricopeptide repeat protein [Kribbella sp. NPDC026611]|uniref:tetratricopeptide repeat protein n=1 Tax=Kribbella sp. NPDC026611 TaxID=3154911 RepID=UPI0033D58C85
MTALLDEGAQRRLLTVVADAGFGKSTLLREWSTGRLCAWHTVRSEDGSLAAMVSGLVDALQRQVPALETIPAELHSPRGPDADAEQQTRALAYAALLADALDENLDHDLTLVLDDLHELDPAAPATRLIEGLVRTAPPTLHVVVASRTPMPFGIDRLRGRGQVLEIDATALAFTVAETHAVLEKVLGDDVDGLAEPLQAAVQGWPAAVRLAVEALRTAPPADRSTRLRRALRSDGPLYDYLAEEVFAAEPPAVRRLVAGVAVLPRFGSDLCQAIGLTHGVETLQQLRTRGLLVSAGEEDGYELNPLVKNFANDRLAVDAKEIAELSLKAGKWFESIGEHRDALACYQAVDPAVVARMLHDRGHAMVSGGMAEIVVAAVASLPAPRGAVMDQLEGEARQVLGDWQGAVECFDRIIEPEGEIPVAVAWRLGLIHHLRGQTDVAIATYERGRLDGQQPTDEALLQAWWAGAHWLRGEFEECRALITAAQQSAKQSGDDRALAIVHTVLAMLAAVDSDPQGNFTNYVRALEHAERGGDLLQSIRIRVNRGSHHVAEGDYQLGLKELDIALELADRAGFAVFRALALNNRGEALLRLGRLDEAIGELEASRSLYQKLDSKRVAQPLSVLGEVYRERGDRAMARACFEEAIVIAEEMKDMQSLVPSLAGLARVLAVEEPERAAELAELARQAVAYGPVLGLSSALVALGWVTLHAGNKTDAAASAEEAAALCRKRRDRAGLADALELNAAAGGGDEVLHEVLNIRNEIGDPLGEARAELMLARRRKGPEGRDLALRAHQQFLAAGATRYAAAALAATEESGPPPVRVECLGGFRVLRNGKAVQLGEWPSKKARDLLKILVARRCRPVARVQLLDLLWPDQDESLASPRLSVALSTVRSVLDPQKRYSADQFVGADRATIWLDGDQTEVDVELFLHDAREGLNTGDLRLLRAAEAAYSGDFLEEDVYADWAAGMREEARALYVRVARVLAERGQRDPDAAAGYLLRILQRDQYDERAHLGLVTAYQASGAHGEARRAYRTYVQRMSELDVEPAAYPAVPARL